MRQAIILVFIFAGLAQAVQSVRVDIIGIGNAGPYRLGYVNIISGSEHIAHTDRILTPEIDYHLNYIEGLITLGKPLMSEDTLHIEFAILPFDLKSSYRQMEPKALTDTAAVDLLPLKRSAFHHSQLEIMGSKGFVINIGNQGNPTLTQSLDLNISGQATEGVFIQGRVNDQNFGSSSSGGTKSLDELDRIFLSLETKNFKGDFGDIELKGVDNSLLDFRRKLTGLSMKGYTGNFNGSSALAFSPGKQKEMFFFGTDGKQGPYILHSSGIDISASRGNAFMPGTEEVYLDSRKLQRGTENDYTIDYYDGYINFNPKNIISSKSRITVKIQCSAENYRRNFYNFNTFRTGKISIGFQYIGEKDDKSSPRSFDLGEIERDVISRAGAVRDSACISGVKYVGDNEGEYISVIDDSLQVPYYKYVGTGAGNYLVSFSRTLSGQGDYNYAGAGVYIYVGEGNGLYLPVIYFPLPKSSDYGSLIIKRQGDLYFDCELAGSRNDRNTLSEIDDIFYGAGFLSNMGYKKENIAFAEKLWNVDIFNLKVRSLDDQFSVPGIIDQPEFFRRYNIPQSRLYSDERLVEIQSSANTLAGNNIGIGGGSFKSDEFDAKRVSGNFNLIAFKQYELSANTEVSESKDNTTGLSSHWNKYESGIRKSKGIIQPGFIYRHELNDGLNAFTNCYKADEYDGGLNLIISSKFTSRSKLLFRDQKTSVNTNGFPNGWVDQFHQYQIEQGLIYGSSGTGFNGEINLSRFYQDRFLPVKETIKRIMGNIKLNYNKTDIGITFYESVNGAGRISREREYIYVGDGNGDYRKDGDDYVPETGADYIEVVKQLDETGLAGYEISGGLRLRANGKVISKCGLLSKIIYDNDFSYRTNLSAATDIQPRHLFPLTNISGDEILYRTYNYNQRTTFRLNQSGDYIRHTFKMSASNGNNYQFEQLDDNALVNTADFKILSRRKVSYLISTEYAAEKRILYSGSIDIKRLGIKLIPEYHPSGMLQIEIPLAYSNENEKARDVKISIYSGGIKTIVNFRQYGRIEVNGGYSRVNTSREDVFLPFAVAAGKKKGDNYNGMITARLKLNSYSRAELRYNYKKLGDGYSNNNLRLEVKAQF
ncbi:MAG: hypothetical protein J7K40_12540 [candidate division Zixibacteria bacterium]|nr:hypothetical protein [candidate division Zixibacteria bacterium]